MAEKTSKDLIVRRRVAPSFPGEIPQADDIKIGRDQILFGKGQWLPSMNPLVIGKENFADLINLRYAHDGLDTVKGHVKINTTPLSVHPKVRALYQLTTPYTIRSLILAQAFNNDYTVASAIYPNLSVVPGAADYGDSILSAAAVQGRFSRWPAGHVAFSDGQLVSVWAGDEMPAAFISLSTHIDFHDEYTQYLQNDDVNIDESIPLQSFDWQQITGAFSAAGSKDLTTNGAAGQAYAGRLRAGRAGSIQGLCFKLKKVGAPAGTLVCKIYSAAGAYPDDYPDNGALLATSAAVTCTTLPAAFGSVIFDFAAPLAVTSGTNYWIVLIADGTYAYTDGVTEVVLYTQTTATSLKATDEKAADGTWNHKPAADLYLSFQAQYKVYIYLGVTRPASGFNVYIDPVSSNDRISTLTMEAAAYSGASIGFYAVTGLVDGTATGGKTAAQAGQVSFSWPWVFQPKPVFINGLSLYWYRMSYSAFLHTAATAPVVLYSPAYAYRILANCGFQAITSLWSGESMILTGFKIYDGTKNQDYTAYMNDESQTTATETQLDSFATSKKIYIQTASPAQGFMFRFIPGSYNGSAAAMQIRRYQGSFVSIANFVDKTALAGVSFGMNGMVAFDVDELDKTLSLDGEAPFYTYEITFSTALDADVELYNVTAIEAPKSIDGYAFPFMFRNRPMLCGYTKGSEGNRVDFGMTDTVDVFTGSDASLGMNNAPLYFGGNEDLTGALEMYNRLGSTIYHVAVFTKAEETHLLSGYDAETYQIYRISGAIGCPAPRTMDTVEIGYGSADQQAELRCIGLWLSFIGPVLCDTATVTPIPGVERYFDRNDTRCINWAAVDKACGIVDLEHLEYHLCIPSGSGQTINNVWLVLDLMKRRWYLRMVSDGNTPQAFCRVVTTNGTPYVYSACNDGYLRRINVGDTWDTAGAPIICVLKSADVLPTGEMWDITRLRRLKLLGTTAAPLSVQVYHYKNGSTTGTPLTPATLAATNRHARHTQPLPIGLTAFSHQLLLMFTAPAGGATLLGMAWQFTVEREDLTAASG